ncbi:MAG: hypothetical protein ACREE6_11970 [Limisphaerales bacterium]
MSKIIILILVSSVLALAGCQKQPASTGTPVATNAPATAPAMPATNAPPH